MNKYAIGIDPDVAKSGVALWNKQTRKYEEITSLNFFDLMEYLNKYKDTATVYLEAGWENKKSNWHYSKNAFVAQRIAKNVGENHRAGKLILEYLIRMNIKHCLLVPKTKKIDAKTFENLTGIKERNQDKRDAAMLVFER